MRARHGVHFLGAALLAALAGWAAAEPPPRALVLVTIDTLRPDHLGAYGYEQPTSPFLDRLAREGVLFENVFASSSMTAPSHASLFTGLYPPQHGVRINDQGFGAENRRRFRTAAEVLDGAGFATAAFSGVGFLRSISQGFRVVDAGSGDYRKYRQADATVDRAIAWLAGRKPGDRFLLWVHLFDAHPPHRPPTHGPLRLGFATPAEAQAFARAAVEKRGVAPDAYPSQAALLEAYAKYDAEIRFADSELGRLFGAMEAAHLNEGALWVVTADHGEGMGNHGWLDHVRFLYDEAVRVPLIVYANRRWAGTRVRDLARHVDVMPTVFDLLGVPFGQAGFSLPGRPLTPLLEGGKLPPVLAFSIRPPWRAEHPEWERGEVFSLRDLDWKYVAHSAGADELFDLRRDPLERQNLAGSWSPVKDRLAEMARELIASLQREGEGAQPTVERAVTEELKALGYVH